MFGNFFNSIRKKIRLYSPISIGMRTFKTWLAVIITATLTLTPMIGSSFYAVMGAIFGVQNTVTHSVGAARYRILGTVVGAMIGFIFAYFELTSPFFIALAIVIVIIICSTFKMEESIFIAFTLCLLTMLFPDREGGLFAYTAFRVLDTAIGLIIGVVVNYYIEPPNYLKKLTIRLEKLHILTEEVRQNRALLPSFKSGLDRLDFLYNNYQVDEKYDKFDDISNEKLEKATQACNFLYFHLKYLRSEDGNMKEYHQQMIDDTLDFIQETIGEVRMTIEETD